MIHRAPGGRQDNPNQNKKTNDLANPTSGILLTGKSVAIQNLEQIAIHKLLFDIVKLKKPLLLLKKTYHDK
jgi:hypothetical protein